jgi:uncharacterized membrane protein
MCLVKRTPTQPDTNALAAIAKQHLRIDTLETRKSDSLDFHDVAVWNVRAALEAAFMAGSAHERAKRTSRRTQEPR